MSVSHKTLPLIISNTKHSTPLCFMINYEYLCYISSDTPCHEYICSVITVI